MTISGDSVSSHFQTLSTRPSNRRLRAMPAATTLADCRPSCVPRALRVALAIAPARPADTHLNWKMVIDAVQVRWQIEEFQSVDGIREMPVPHGASAAKPSDVRLFSMGVAAATCSGN